MKSFSLYAQSAQSIAFSFLPMPNSYCSEHIVDPNNECKHLFIMFSVLVIKRINTVCRWYNRVYERLFKFIIDMWLVHCCILLVWLVGWLYECVYAYDCMYSFMGKCKRIGMSLYASVRRCASCGTVSLNNKYWVLSDFVAAPSDHKRWNYSAGLRSV